MNYRAWPTPANRLIVADCETFGLDLEKEPMIEIGFAMVDLSNFEIVDTISKTIWGVGHEKLHGERLNQEWYRNMHVASGLIDRARSFGRPVAEVDSEFSHYLRDEWGVAPTEPLVGSSVQFDRLRLERWMPKTHSLFSYRNIDVSTVKELCMRRNPELYARAQEDIESRKLHRVISDIEDTVEELKWYDENFLFIPGGARD